MHAAVLEHEVLVRPVARVVAAVGGDRVPVVVEDVAVDPGVRAVADDDAVSEAAVSLVVVDEVVVDLHRLRARRVADPVVVVVDADRRVLPSGDLVVVDLDVVPRADVDRARRPAVLVRDAHVRPLDAQPGDADVVALDQEQPAGTGRRVQPRAGRPSGPPAGDGDALGDGDVLVAAEVELDAVLDADGGPRRADGLAEQRLLVVGVDRDLLRQVDRDRQRRDRPRELARPPRLQGVRGVRDRCHPAGSLPGDRLAVQLQREVRAAVRDRRPPSERRTATEGDRPGRHAGAGDGGVPQARRKVARVLRIGRDRMRRARCLSKEREGEHCGEDCEAANGDHG